MGPVWPAVLVLLFLSVYFLAIRNTACEKRLAPAVVLHGQHSAARRHQNQQVYLV